MTNGAIINTLKAIYEKTTAKIIPNRHKLKAFLLRSKAMQCYPRLPHLFNTVLNVLTETSRQKKDIKSILMRNDEVKHYSLLTTWSYIENLKDFNKIARTNNYSKVAEYKLNTQKWVVVLYYIIKCLKKYQDNNLHF